MHFLHLCSPHLFVQQAISTYKWAVLKRNSAPNKLFRATFLSPVMKRKYVNGDDEKDFEKVESEVGSLIKVP